MKRNKIIALLLSLILVLNLGISAMAADAFTKVAGEGDTTDKQITNTGNISSSHITEQGVKVPTLIQTPLIEVTLGIPGNIIVNPFGIKFKDSGNTDETSTAEIISVPSTITNKSGVAVKLSLQPTVNAADSVTVDEVGSASLTDNTKKVIQVKMATLNDTAANVADASKYTATPTIVKKSNSDVAELKLDKSDGAKPCGGYMFSGETSGSDWTTADTVTVNVLFKITAMGNGIS